jgi:hypothetical protein
MTPIEDFIADFFAEDSVERVGVMAFTVSSWLVSVVNRPPDTLAHSLIQIVPPLLGIWVAHRSMERAHELRMERLKADIKSDTEEAKDAD